MASLFPKSTRYLQYLESKKYLFKKKEGYGDQEVHIVQSDKKQGGIIYIDRNFSKDQLNYNFGLELDMPDSHSPAYIRAFEYFDEKGNITSYSYTFRWERLIYKFYIDGNFKKEQDFFYRYEMNPRSRPHCHFLHEYPKIQTQQFDDFTQFVDYIENYLYKNKFFSMEFPWDRSSAVIEV